MIWLIDETRDCKKGNHTNYVKRQYIGNVGKQENSIVVITAYGLFQDMVELLKIKPLKPKRYLLAMIVLIPMEQPRSAPRDVHSLLLP